MKRVFRNLECSGLCLNTGTARIEVIGLDDKRMITATFTTTLNGVFLPIQLLYTGKTPRCHPHYIGFPDEFGVWHSPNHWANQDTSLRFISQISIPYIQKTQAEKLLSPYHPALILFDVFCGQIVNELWKICCSSADMKLTIMKEVGAQWLVSMYDYLRGNHEICKNGFLKAGIAQAISNQPLFHLRETLSLYLTTNITLVVIIGITSTVGRPGSG